MLLASVTIGGGALVTGCATTPPWLRLPGQPLTTEQQIERIRMVATTLDQARINATTWKATPAQVTVLDWALDTIASQCEALRMEVPPRTSVSAAPLGSASPAGTPSPIPTASTTPVTSPIATLMSVLRQTGQHHHVDALADPEHPLVWASMAAWAFTTADLLEHNRGLVAPTQPLKMPRAVKPAEALNQALSACHQMHYALPVMLSVPQLNSSVRATIVQAHHRWTALRDTLIDAVRATGSEPVVAEPWYDITPPATVVEAERESGLMQLKALPHLGVGIAFGPVEYRGILADALTAETRSLPMLTTPIPRWPGLIS